MSEEKFKLVVDWSNIKKEYVDAGIDISQFIMPDSDLYTIKCDNKSYDGICTASDYTCSEYKSKIAERDDEIKVLKSKTADLEKLVEYWKNEAIAASHNISSLTAAIDFCKKNGIWVEDSKKI